MDTLKNKVAEAGTWNGIATMLLGVSGALKIDATFTAFGFGHNEWATITFAAAMCAAALGVWFKG